MYFFILAFDKYWCEPPLLKNEPIPNYDLIQVHVITRHGARTPLHISKTLNQKWICNNTEFQALTQNKSNPSHIYVTYGKSLFLGDCHFGQLTGLGIQNLKKLGQHIKKIYSNDYKLIPTHYSEKNSNFFYFRTTSTHRTFHSAMSFLDGLYPNHPPIEIEVADKMLDPWKKSSHICPKLKNMLEIVRDSPEFHNKFSQNVTLINHANISKIIGVKDKTASDIILPSRCSSMKLPQKISTKTLDMVSYTKAQMQKYVYESENVWKLGFSYILTQMMNEFILKINGGRKKFIYWSGHDGNIFAFLGYGKVDYNLLPPFGSYVLAELWKKQSDFQSNSENSQSNSENAQSKSENAQSKSENAQSKSDNSNNYFIRFIYNGKPLILPRIYNNSLIPFDILSSFLKENMPDPEKDCGLIKSKFEKATVFSNDRE